MSRKTYFFQGSSWFKLNNLELALGMALKFYTNMTRELKLKVKKFLGLILTFVEVTGGKLVGWDGGDGGGGILNRVKLKEQFI